MGSIWFWVRTRLHPLSEPAAWVGVLGTAAELFRGATTWQDFWPVAAAAVVRWLVTPVYDRRPLED